MVTFVASRNSFSSCIGQAKEPKMFLNICHFTRAKKEKDMGQRLFGLLYEDCKWFSDKPAKYVHLRIH